MFTIKKSIECYFYMKTIILPLVFCLLVLHINAQNLVPNPSFEIVKDTNTISFYPENWFSLSSTTDFFHRDNPSNTGLGIPLNFRGNQQPAEGDACAGIICHGVGPSKEFLAVKLVEALKKDSLYNVSFKVNLSNDCRYALDDVGLTFFEFKPTSENIEEAIYHIKNQENVFITDTVSWTVIEGFYKANGNEQYIVIGNFYEEKNTGVKVSDETKVEWSYYYVDEVFVELCSKAPQEFTIIDTLICTGIPTVLSGLENASNYYWVNIDAKQDIVIDQPGSYVVNNYFGCYNKQLVYNVGALTCDCTMKIPTIQLSGNVLKYILSDNVVSAEMKIYNLEGKDVANGLNYDNIMLPNTSSFLVWQTKLKCISENSLVFDKTVTGKLFVINP